MFRLLTVLSVCFLLSSNVFALQVESNRFEDILNHVKKEVKEHGADQVLVVYDIDHTLLAMKNPFGGDAWWGWQSKGLEEGDPAKVSPSFPGLLRVQKILFEIGHMSPPEENIPAIVEEIQNMGVKSIAMTSRGYDMRFMAERELGRNGISFRDSAIGPVGGYPSKYIPLDGSRLEDYGLEADALDKYKLRKKPTDQYKARPVSYQDGIYMLAGQHKGVMLRLLTQKTGTSFKSIVFADDHKKHTDRVEAAYADLPIETMSFRYGKMDEVVERFNESGTDVAKEKWDVLNAAIKKAFGTLDFHGE